MTTLQILGASWGQNVVTSTVIDQVNRQTSPQSLTITASNSLFGDTWPGQLKTLFIAYRYGDAGRVAVATAKEGSSISIRGPQATDEELGDNANNSPTLKVYAAAWGPADCTAAVRRMINTTGQTLSFTPNDDTFGDPWVNHLKTFTIVAGILNAAWGLHDITDTIQGFVSRRSIFTLANNIVLGVDGWPGQQKSLVVVYQYGTDQPQTAVTTEGSLLVIDYQAGQPPYQPPLDPDSLNVIGATWGRSIVTSTVLKQITGGKTLNFAASNSVFGDSWPGQLKSFVLSYSWGPGSPRSIIVKEGDPVQVLSPRPNVPAGLVQLTGLVADGDVVAIQSGLGKYLAVTQSGQIKANADSIGPSSSFTVHLSRLPQEQLTLSNGNLNIVVGADGTLSTSRGAGARFVPSLTTTGTLIFSVVGAAKTFAILNPDGSITAAGSDELTFNTTFNLALNPTRAGLENHIARLGVDITVPDDASDLALIKLVWDLTGGMFLAIGLGPLLNGSQEIQTGVFALIKSSKPCKAALDALIEGVKGNLGTTLSAGVLLAFAGTVWDAGLMWKILRFALSLAGWYGIGWALTKILSFIVPIGQATQVAQLVVSFTSWAYTTTTDAIAFINSTGGRRALTAIATGLPVSSKSEESRELADPGANGVADESATQHVNGGEAVGVNGTANGDIAHSGEVDVDHDEEDLVHQLKVLEIQSKLKSLRKRRLMGTPPASMRVI